eukprot:TRINITY_DN1456_c3_g1_i1.p1 TRINITY_DN1456_c3_g1~~TRINITY_DN1456_c3_g1_i1.p1  ORF type:complete len:403 (-),score=157.43 TRINITY_DN1456_c3_g1_i1:54-1262(-)
MSSDIINDDLNNEINSNNNNDNQINENENTVENIANTINNNDEEIEEDQTITIEEQADVVMAILVPVSITMWFSVWLVCAIMSRDSSENSWYFAYGDSVTSSFDNEILVAVLYALFFVVMIVIVTVIFVCLYKYRCLKIIFGWLMLSTGLLFLLFGGLLFFAVFHAYNLPMDWITFSIFIWNLSVGGMLTIFFYSAYRINQAYMIIISVLMAVFFVQLPEWTTIAVLAAVAIYDLFSVLCPRGPLKVLVEIAQERKEPIPALLYSGTLFFMAKEDELQDNQSIELEAVSNNTLNNQEDSQLQTDVNQDTKPRLSRSVKLGLGDFVFYSVLIGRAALYDVLTVTTCYISIITGLFFTMLLLAFFRRAMPALPISIALGIIFYFASNYIILPFVLILGSDSVFI